MKKQVITFYECEICGLRWRDEKDCIECEKSLPEKPNLKVGDVIEVMTRYDGYVKRTITKGPYLEMGPSWRNLFGGDEFRIHDFDHLKDHEDTKANLLKQTHTWYVDIDEDFKYGKDSDAFGSKVSVSTYVKGFRSNE